jgi:malectin (di-glucose binding ER protein)
VWQADTGFNSGNVYSSNASIGGTSDATLYKDERYGNFAYNFTVPNGSYSVTLKFAEIYWTTAGKRVFNVAINGQQVLGNFDILAQPNAAPNTALDRSFPVTVTGGMLNISFTTVVDNAQINAIEIVSAPSAPSSIRVNAGGDAYTSPDGRGWQIDTFFTGGTVYRPSPAPSIARTQDPTLYQSERYGNFSYAFSVPNGQYLVGLRFAEIYWTTAGSRVFNVSINGQQVLTNFDILAQPGAVPNAAVDRTFPVNVTGGTIGITFTTLVDNAQVNAIEIVPAPATRINTGGGAYTGSDGRAWQADTGFSAGNVYNPTPNIARTQDQVLYQSERYGNFTYNVAVPNGSYTVVLKFSEIYWRTAGSRVFNVSINGQQVLGNFDILAQPNSAPNTALDRSFPVTVTGGNLAITFTTVTDNAKINAIEIVPGT